MVTYLAGGKVVEQLSNLVVEKIHEFPGHTLVSSTSIFLIIWKVSTGYAPGSFIVH